MVFRTQRRFIAGAVCPRCSKMDKLVVFKKDGHTVRECVSCGYHQQMASSPTFEPLPTRLDAVREKTQVEERREVVRIITSDKTG